MTTKYWVFKVKEETGGLYRRSGIEIYNHRMADGFWGLKEDSDNFKEAAIFDKLEKGDRVLFYLVEAGRESRFLGTATLGSGIEKLDEEKATTIVHKDYLDGDRGVYINAIDKWQNYLSVECLRGKGPFGDGRAKFSPFFKGNVKQLGSHDEFEIIFQEHMIVNADLKTPKKKRTHFLPKQPKKLPHRT